MKLIIWIDRYVDSDENSIYFDQLNTLNNCKIIRIKEVDDAINQLNEIAFEETIIIVSGQLFTKFFDEFRKNLNNIRFKPNIIIFTSKKIDFINSIDYNHRYYINHKFYNSGGVEEDFSKIFEFVKKPVKKKLIFLKRDDDVKFNFDYIDTKEKLVLPMFYKHLIELTETDNEAFINFLYKKYYYKSKEMRKFLESFESVSDLPVELLSKYYSRIYTDDESKFYSDLNNDLRNNKRDQYLTYIKTLYEGVKLKSLPLAENSTLYRGTKLPKKEIDTIKEYKNKQLENNLQNLPGAIIFSKTFLSFSKDEEVAINFFNQTPTPTGSMGEFYKVLFILEKEDPNIDENENYSLSTHADIEKLSIMPDEREVLFFPFSSFEIKNIDWISQYGIYKINLLYLGRYTKDIENDQNLINNKVEIPKTEFTKEIIQSNLIKPEIIKSNLNKPGIIIQKFSKNKENNKKIKKPNYQTFNPIYPVKEVNYPISVPIVKKPYKIKRIFTSTSDDELKIDKLIDNKLHVEDGDNKSNTEDRNKLIDEKRDNNKQNIEKIDNNKIIVEKIERLERKIIIPPPPPPDLSDDNFISGQIIVNENDVNKYIRVINSFEQAKIKYNYLKIDNELKYKNEKEIMENCKIKINNIEYRFSYFYSFKKPGIYEIKYSFKSNITKTDFMFAECFNLISLDLLCFKSNKVTNMVGMFLECTNLKELKISNLDTHNVNDMNSTFCGCQSLPRLDLSYFNTQNVINMSRLFFNCQSLRSINVSSFNTQNVIDMYGMFNGCRSLLNLEIMNFYTQNVTNMSRMFFGCSSLKYLNLSNFNTNKVAYMNSMFFGCTSLLELNIDNFDTQKVINKDDMFIGCISLNIGKITCKYKDTLFKDGIFF